MDPKNMHLVKANVRLLVYHVAADASMKQALRPGYWARGIDCAWDGQQRQPRSRPPTICAQGAKLSPSSLRWLSTGTPAGERPSSTSGVTGFEGHEVVGAIFKPSMHRAPTPTHAHNHRVRLASQRECLQFPQNHYNQGSLGLSGGEPWLSWKPKEGMAHG